MDDTLFIVGAVREMRVIWEGRMNVPEECVEWADRAYTAEADLEDLTRLERSYVRLVEKVNYYIRHLHMKQYGPTIFRVEVADALRDILIAAEADDA